MPEDERDMAAVWQMFADALRERITTRGGSTHQYTSTACYHDEHAQCRMTCKFCSQPCRCPCHRSEVMAHA